MSFGFYSITLLWISLWIMRRVFFINLIVVVKNVSDSLCFEIKSYLERSIIYQILGDQIRITACYNNYSDDRKHGWQQWGIIQNLPFIVSHKTCSRWQRRVACLFVSCSTPNYADKRMNGGNLVVDWCKLTLPSFHSTPFIRPTKFETDTTTYCVIQNC